MRRGEEMDAIIAVARDWIETPYVHQASVRGAGADCLGLILGVWRAVVGDAPDNLPAYTSDWSEPQNEETMWRAASEHLVPIPREPLIPGSVILMRMRDGGIAKHLGIVADGEPEPTFIHAYSGHSVTESPLSSPWRRRIVAQFRFPIGER